MECSKRVSSSEVAAGSESVVRLRRFQVSGRWTRFIPDLTAKILPKTAKNMGLFSDLPVGMSDNDRGVQYHVTPLFTVIYQQWAGLDSNQRRRKPADLQSAPFGHSGTYPITDWLSPACPGGGP